MVPTVVTDRSGTHLSGLSREQFTILQDGIPQRIELFEEVKSQAGSIRRVSANDSEFTNVVSDDAKRQRLTIIVLDTLNTRFQDQVHARDSLLKFVEESLHPGEPVTLMTLGSSGLNVMNDFTTDPTVLASAIRKIRGEQSASEKRTEDAADMETELEIRRQMGRRVLSETEIGEQLWGFRSGAFDRFQNQQMDYTARVTLEALRQIAEAFSGVPGRKSLIWVTGGLPFVPDDTSGFGNKNSSLFNAYAAAWEAMTKSQIAVYPLDMGGLFSPGLISPRYRRAYGLRRQVDSVSNLETFAKMTGGEFCPYKMDVRGCFEHAQSDAQQFYLLGFYPDTKKLSPGWHKIEIGVSRPQTKIRARTNFFVPSKPANRNLVEKQDIDTAILSPTDFTAVPMEVRWLGKEIQGEKTRYKFEINIPGTGASIDSSSNNLVSITFAAFAKTERGGIAGDFVKELEGNLPAAMAQEALSKGITYDGDILVPKGHYTVRFIVRDNLGARMGSLSVPLENN
jgi:VWFA-related protein